jgi:hypothetical protein
MGAWHSVLIYLFSLTLTIGNLTGSIDSPSAFISFYTVL